MALGGGLYTEQDKIMPGAYHDIHSEQNNDIVLSDRGTVAVAMTLDWQPTDVIRMQNKKNVNYTDKIPQWTRDCRKVFGFDHNAPELINIRELFRHAKEIIIYPLGTAIKASNTFGTATNGGVRGNAIATVVTKNVDDQQAFDVMTYVDLRLVDTQTVKTAAELENTEWVAWKKDAILAETASTPMTGGDNAKPTGEDHMAALTEFEQLRFDELICSAADETTIKLYVEWTIRMNEEYGHWHGLTVYNYLADNNYVTAVKNTVEGGKGPELVYYTGGEQAACPAKEVTDNNNYTGEYVVLEATKNMQELESLLRQGYYLYHKVENVTRVLADNNTLVSYTAEKGPEFSSNQTIRVFFQLAIDSDKIFVNEFLGKAGTNDFDITNFKMRMVALRLKLQSIGAIKNFQSSDLVVTAGEQYDAYYMREYIQPNFCVRKLYTETVVGTKKRGE